MIIKSGYGHNSYGQQSGSNYGGKRKDSGYNTGHYYPSEYDRRGQGYSQERAEYVSKEQVSRKNSATINESVSEWDVGSHRDNKR